MNHRTSRGHGVGIEVSVNLLRGVRLDPDRDGRIAAAGEFAVEPGDADALLDGFVLLRAELGDPQDPTTIAMFPTGSVMQRVDVTGRPEAELTELRAEMRTHHAIGSSMTVDDGPRRWMLFIRWDEGMVLRLIDTATRAGFVDVRLEPSPLSIARIAGTDATYERRRVAQGEAHHAVLHHRLPVAALSTVATGRTHPDVDIAAPDVTLAAFDEHLDDTALAETLDRVAARTDASGGAAGRTSSPHFDLAGIDSVPYPDHDVRSPRRQVVALGAAVGAADLTGPVDRLRMVGPDAGIGGDPFDRPWAIEALPPGEDDRHDDAANGIERVTRWFRSHRPH